MRHYHYNVISLGGGLHPVECCLVFELFTAGLPTSIFTGQ